MTESIEDLTPFFEDRCWMFVHLARQAHVGVIVRRVRTRIRGHHAGGHRVR